VDLSESAVETAPWRQLVRHITAKNALPKDAANQILVWERQLQLTSRLDLGHNLADKPSSEVHSNEVNRVLLLRKRHRQWNSCQKTL
jgi:hypothetical protein